ncbi:MAG: hypothetical protein WBQ34_15715 [Candidatus Acidiferrales bacterium]
MPTKPLRFPRLNEQVKALIGKENLTNRKRLRRALRKLDLLERTGVNLYDGAKAMK